MEAKPTQPPERVSQATVPSLELLDLELRQVLAPDGTLIGEPPDLEDKQLVEMYRAMVTTRQIDRRALAAQRQGRLGTYAMSEGHEAIHIGSAGAFAADDFIYPAYRQHGLQMARGMPAEVVYAYWRGLPNETWDVHRYNMMSIAVPIASQIPQAVGHAYADRLAGHDTVVATYFGDGATSETDFHAGLNFAGVWKTPNVFICENNLYAISVPYEKQTASETIAQKAVAYGIAGVRVDGMDALAVRQVTSEAVARARAGDGPTLIEALCFRYGPHATADDASLYRSQSEVEDWVERDPIARLRRFLVANELWSEAEDDELIARGDAAFADALEAIEATPEASRDSIVRHAYHRVPDLLIEQLHAMQRRADEPETEFSVEERWPRQADPPPPADAPVKTMATAINEALHQAMEADDTSILLGEDVGVAGGVFRITQGLYDEFGEDRVIDTPINESGIVGAAIGMAIAGSTAVAEIQFEGFVYPAFDQIVSHLGRLRFRTRGHATAPVVVRFPNGAGIGAHEHHCDSPEAFFMHAPGLVVVTPSTAYDAKGLLLAAIRTPDPVIFMEPKVLYHAARDAVPNTPYELPLGVARTARSGSDLTLVTYGGMAPVSLRSAERAEAEGGISTEVIDLRTIYPWDVAAVVASVERTGRLLVVQEPQLTAGVGAEVAATLAERCAYTLAAPIRRVGATDAPWPQFAIERHALIDEDHILAAIEETMAG